MKLTDPGADFVVYLQRPVGGFQLRQQNRRVSNGHSAARGAEHHGPRQDALERQKKRNERMANCATIGPPRSFGKRCAYLSEYSPSRGLVAVADILNRVVVVVGSHELKLGLVGVLEDVAARDATLKCKTKEEQKNCDQHSPGRPFVFGRHAAGTSRVCVGQAGRPVGI